MSNRDKIKVMLIEDEQPAIEILRSYLRDVQDWEIVGEFDNPVDALSYLATDHVDVIFLDIQLPRLSGMEFLKTLQKRPLVIITSAFREHAIEAFELVVFDYLLKPFDLQRFLQTINRANEILAGRQDHNEKSLVGEEFIYLTVDRKYTRVRLADILYVESKKEYVHVVTTHGTLRAKQSLSATSEALPFDFIRIHRSYIVNSKHVNAYSKVVVEVLSTELPIGESYSKDVSNRLKELF